MAQLQLEMWQDHAQNPIYQVVPDALELLQNNLREHLNHPDWRIFVADVDGDPVGTLSCWIIEQKFLFVPRRFGYIGSVYVKPAFRRRGLTRQLTELAIQFCRAQSVTQVRLNTDVSNPVSNATWQALGFKPAAYTLYLDLM